MDEYALALQRMYGEHILEELNQKKWISTYKKFTRAELVKLINAYKPLSEAP